MRRGIHVEQLVVATLTVPDLVTGVPSVREDRSDRARRPPARVAVRVSRGIGRCGGGDRVAVEAAGDGRVAGAGESLGEDPLHDARRLGIRFQAIQRRADACLLGIRMRADRRETVAVRRSTTEIAATSARHRRHRGLHATLSAEYRVSAERRRRRPTRTTARGSDGASRTRAQALPYAAWLLQQVHRVAHDVGGPGRAVGRAGPHRVAHFPPGLV